MTYDNIREQKRYVFGQVMVNPFYDQTFHRPFALFFSSEWLLTEKSSFFSWVSKLITFWRFPSISVEVFVKLWTTGHQFDKDLSTER